MVMNNETSLYGFSQLVAVLSCSKLLHPANAHISLNYLLYLHRTTCVLTTTKMQALKLTTQLHSINLINRIILKHYSYQSRAFCTTYKYIIWLHPLCFLTIQKIDIPCFLFYFKRYKIVFVLFVF